MNPPSTQPHLSSCINDVLSVELLSEIFLFCAGGSMEHAQTVATPLKMSWVCQYWRSTALSTPRLWSRFFIKINRANSVLQTEKTKTWMDRSGGCPLTIFVFWKEQVPGFATHTALDAMISHCHRWYHIFAYLPSCAFPCLNPVRGNLPLLKELNLGTNDLRAQFESLDAFEIAPRLRTFKCQNIDSFRFALPWTQLEDIPMMMIAPQECLELQARCPRLEKASFVLPFHSKAHLGSPPLVRLERLHTVNFISSPRATFLDVTPVFEHATYPNLRMLQLCHFKLAPMPHLSSFLLRSPCLQTLILRGVNIAETDLIQCLEAVPSLTRLEIFEEKQLLFGNVVGEVTLQLLSHRDGEACHILPKLKRLHISTSSLPLDSFLDMVESRFLNELSSSQLQVVRLDTPVELDENSARRQHSLRQLGLDIVVAPLSWR